MNKNCKNCGMQHRHGSSRIRHTRNYFYGMTRRRTPFISRIANTAEYGSPSHTNSCMHSDEHTQATQCVSENTKILSMTTDNGIENRDHERWGMPTFFCDPYSSWQKGGIENANKMLRRYFPKGTDFDTVTQKQIDSACDTINDKPRKILGYWSAREVAEKAKLFKNTSVLIQG